jgi:hypothetical protein
MVNHIHDIVVYVSVHSGIKPWINQHHWGVTWFITAEARSRLVHGR